MKTPRLCVLDTCVASDIHTAALWAALARLPLDVLLPADIARIEFREPELAEARRAGVTIELLDEHEESRADNLAATYRKPSTADLTALAMAESRRAVLLTSDKDLRGTAESEGVETHGVLWLLDEMVARGAIAPRRAAQALTAMLEAGSRLPQVECRRRLAAWRN